MKKMMQYPSSFLVLLVTLAILTASSAFASHLDAHSDRELPGIPILETDQG